MPGDQKFTLEHHREHETRIQAILAEPDFKSAEERLLAIFLRRAIDFNNPPLGKGQQFSEAVIKSLWPTGMPYRASAYRGLLKEDILRYDPFAEPGAYARRETCPAWLPRAKRPCGKSTSSFWLATQIETGEKVRVGYCTQHKEEDRKAHTADRERVKAAGDTIPRPHANTGGRVRKHCPEIGWPELWKQVDPTWEPFPERDPILIKPTLRLIAGGVSA